MTVDLHAETSVLGSMILSRLAIADVRPILATDDFYRGAHSTVYAAICDLAGRGEPVDTVTLSDELDRRGHLADVGGPVAVSDFAAQVPSAATATYYARIVADLSVRRQLGADATRAATDALDLTIPVDDTAAMLRDTVTGSRNSRIRCLSDAELDVLKPPKWLIDGHIPEGLTVLWGPSEAGKSFVVIDWSYSLAAGKAWMGKPVDRRPVVYVAAEGAASFRTRRDAWRKDRLCGTKGLSVIDSPVNMLDPRDAAAVSGHVRDTGAGLLVLDTLARTMVGNENDTEVMGAYVTACDRIKAEHGCSVWIVHHAGIEPGRMRGNTALYGAADSVVQVTRNKDGEVVVAQPPAPAGKAKDSPHFAPWYLRLSEVDVGHDDDGEVLTSCVLSTGKERVSAGDIERTLSDGEPRSLMDLARESGADLGALNAMVAGGQLERVYDGGPTARYGLPQTDTTYTGPPL